MALLAVACADQLGYNYQPVEHANTGLSFTPGNGYVPPAATGSIVREPSISAGPAPEQSYQAPAELTKEFFTYTADESDFQAPANAQQLSNTLKRNLRVVFIKGPENSGLENAALALAKHSAEQQTAIYVLNKQANINDLAEKLNTVRTNNNNKPEVHFVKYRTPEDAQNAQRVIQEQYDQLGGVSSHQDGGVAQVLNFASRAPAPAPAPLPQEPQNSYLPASLLRQRL